MTNKIGLERRKFIKGDNIHTRIHTHYTTSLIMYAAWFCSTFQAKVSAYDELYASLFFNALDIFPPGVRTGQFWSRRGEKLGRGERSIILESLIFSFIFIFFFLLYCIACSLAFFFKLLVFYFFSRYYVYRFPSSQNYGC